jgi:50S ribosomal protein L16 3-hydroxylase
MAKCHADFKFQQNNLSKELERGRFVYKFPVQTANPASTFENIISPMSVEKFRELYYLKQPCAIPSAALSLRQTVAWPLVSEILETKHDDCWLAERGRLSKMFKATGVLTEEEASFGFSRGNTIVIRHAEQVSKKIAEIGQGISAAFSFDPYDVQLYATPGEHQGFDWHYDLEDVFVIQSSGVKEFSLLVPSKLPPLNRVDLSYFREVSSIREMRCLLTAGDFLYIPAGVWHKAYAHAPSFHMSIGIMSSERLRK